MKPVETRGLVRITRRIDDVRNAMCAEAVFDKLFHGFFEHAERWETGLDGLTATMMRQGLAATALHLSFRPKDESVGFTLNFANPPVNLFLSGDAGTSSLTGRAFTEGVRTGRSSRMFVQTYRHRPDHSESYIEFEGLDVLDVFELYYRQSVQTPARFYELENDRFVMVMGLPDADRQWIEALETEELAAWMRAPLRSLDRRTIRFHCGCTREKMLETVRSLFASRPDELFQGEDGVETSCPRCGTRWWIEREAFETEF